MTPEQGTWALITFAVVTGVLLTCYLVRRKMRLRLVAERPAQVAMPRYSGDLEQDLKVIEEMQRRGWTQLVYGDRNDPVAVAFLDVQEYYAGIFVMRGHDNAGACRVPMEPGSDPFRQTVCSDYWVGTARQAAQWLLGLGVPAVPLDASTTVPQACRMPTMRPVIIRPNPR